MKLIYKNGGFVFMKTEDILNLIEKRILWRIWRS